MDHTYTNGCFEKLHYQITFWAIPCLMTLVLISACFVCLQNKANSLRRYQSDDEATLIELQVPILLSISTAPHLWLVEQSFSKFQNQWHMTQAQLFL